MIKFLFKNFRNTPGIGDPIKVAYVGYLVNNLVKKTDEGESKQELKNLGADETEKIINKTAKDMFDEAIGPVLAENNIPASLVEPVKKKAINKLTASLKKKAMEKVG